MRSRGVHAPFFDLARECAERLAALRTRPTLLLLKLGLGRVARFGREPDEALALATVLPCARVVRGFARAVGLARVHTLALYLPRVGIIRCESGVRPRDEEPGHGRREGHALPVDFRCHIRNLRIILIPRQRRHGVSMPHPSRGFKKTYAHLGNSFSSSFCSARRARCRRVLIPAGESLRTLHASSVDRSSMSRRTR